MGFPRQSLPSALLLVGWSLPLFSVPRSHDSDWGHALGSCLIDAPVPGYWYILGETPGRAHLATGKPAACGARESALHAVFLTDTRLHSLDFHPTSWHYGGHLPPGSFPLGHSIFPKKILRRFLLSESAASSVAKAERYKYICHPTTVTLCDSEQVGPSLWVLASLTLNTEKNNSIMMGLK